jgi:2-polyprenyl-6-methoxyphenol hydroxylase-like FAD-dependent oxidoreductase
VADGNLCIVLNRIDVWQVAFVHAKGDFKQLREKGIEHFRQGLRQTIPWLQDRVDTITDFSDLHILNVRADMLDTWYLNGLLLIGDSAHAMSPVGGIGINFAIADAIETANILSEPLLAGACTSMHLAEVQNRRFKATKTVQGIQTRILNQITSRAFANKEFDLPWLVRVLLKTPFLRDIPARLMAFGPYQAKIHKP